MQLDSTTQQKLLTFSDILRRKKSGDKHLQKRWGAGSQLNKERQAANGQKNQKQASQSYSLAKMIEKQKAIAVKRTQDKEKSVDIPDEAELASNISIPVACDPLIFQRQVFKNLRPQALASLTRLLNLVIKQEKKYGYRLGVQSNFYQRHLMVKHFLAIQKRISDKDRQDLAKMVASTFDRDKTMGQNIVS